MGTDIESERLRESPSVDCFVGVNDHFLRSHKTNWSSLFSELEVKASVTSSRLSAAFPPGISFKNLARSQ